MMTKKEVGKILALMRELFPQGKDITAETVNAWYWIIGEYDYKVAEYSVKELATSYDGYGFPTPAHLIEKMRVIADDVIDYGGMWDAIVKASKNSTYNAKEEFEKLPAECQAFIGSPAVLKDFGMIEPNVLQTVVKASFNKSMPKIAEHHKIQGELPIEVRQAIAESKAKMLEG